MDSVVISNESDAHMFTEPIHGLTIITVDNDDTLYTISKQTYRHEILNIEALEELIKEAQNV